MPDNPTNYLVQSATGSGSAAANAVTTQNVTVTGASPGDLVVASWASNAPTGVSVSGYVSAADTVTLEYTNPTAGAVSVASATVSIAVLKFL